MQLPDNTNGPQSSQEEKDNLPQLGHEKDGEKTIAGTTHPAKTNYPQSNSADGSSGNHDTTRHGSSSEEEKDITV